MMLPPTAVFLLLSILCLLPTGECTNSNVDGALKLDSVPTDDNVYAVTGEYDEGDFPLTTTWSLIDSFLHTVSPAPPPYELINGFIGGKPISVAALTSEITQFTGNLLGFAICFVIGALFCLIFPLVCTCFCCCRCCCKNCGGKMYQKTGNNDRVKRVVFGLMLTICLGFIIGGVGVAFSVNTFASENAVTLPTEAIGSIRDILNYVNFTLKEINFVVKDQLSYTLAQVIQDLGDLDQLVGVPVRDALSTEVKPALDAIYPLATNISDTHDALLAVNTTQADVEERWLTVRGMVDKSLTDINAACTTCSCCSGASYPDVTGLSMQADWRDIDTVTGEGTFPQPVIDAAIDEVGSLVNQNLVESADKGRATFDDIPGVLKNTTQAEITNIITTINKLGIDIPGQLNEVTSSVNGFTEPVDSLDDTISDSIPFIEEYDPYRRYALIAFYSILLVIAFFLVCGLALGVAGYDRSVSPSQRGGVSNCGGICLMLGVYTAFLFMVFFMLFTMLLFILGGPVDRLVCDPLLTGEFFEETIDKEDAIVPGYFLGDAFYQNGNISLTVTDILNGCSENKAAFGVFMLSNFLNISSVLDYKQFIPDINTQFDSVIGDLTNVDILSNETEQILIDFRDSSATSINLSMFKLELAKNLTNDVNDPNDLSVVAALLSTFAATLSGSDRTTFQGFAGDLSTLQTMRIAPLLTQRDVLSANIATLEQEITGVGVEIDNTIETAEAAQLYLDTNASRAIRQQISQFSMRILNYLDVFVRYTVDQLENEIGRCQPIYNAWNTSINIICRGVLESLNALWLIMGWCIFFLLVGTVVSVKLAKHYRRMKYDDYYQNDNMEMQPTARNKVAPI